MEQNTQTLQENITTNQSTERKIIRVAKYMRCSTGKQELLVQNDQLEVYLKRLKEDNPNIDYIIKSYEDAGVSGKNANRLGLQQLLKDIQKGDINLVIFVKLDRLGRSLQDLLQITSVFKQHNVNFVSTEQNIDTSTSVGNLMFQIIGAFAEFERNIIVERVNSGLKRIRLTGITKSGKAPNRPKVKVDEDGVVFKYKQGITMNNIAKMYGVSITPIRRILITRGELKDGSK